MTRLSLTNPSSSSVDEQIRFEKRRRNQAYKALDYILARVSYFDFFSSNAFTLALYSKYFTQLYTKKIVTSEYLLLPFFYCESNVSTFLEKYTLSESFLQILENKTIISKPTWRNPLSFFDTSERQIKGITFNPKIKYSLEVNQLFEKAAENAMTRFKTPVITSEILFITLMEERKTKASKMIEELVGDDTEWQMLRYRLIKRLHNQESSIRSEVPKNQHYFTYLLKTELKEAEFEKMLETETLVKGTSIFRNQLISEIVKVDIFELLCQEVRLSIQISNKRTYSS